MRPTRPPRGRWLLAFSALCVVAVSCGFDTGIRWLPPRGTTAAAEEPLCVEGSLRCSFTLDLGDPSNVEICARDGAGALAWTVSEDCVANDQVCDAGDPPRCVNCIPGLRFCNGQEARQCDATGDTSTSLTTCEPAVAEACRGGVCVNLCEEARELRSNVGCEYWPVDLDNASITANRNAAAQQYAVVVSNPQPDVPVEVVITEDRAAVGEEAQIVETARAVLAPLTLRVFRLGPREVDGSPPGQFNAGTDTALTRNAYKVESDFPVVVYQFNPLENVNVFSNDASLLKPVEALTSAFPGPQLSYVVASWPQTISITNDPDTNFSTRDPINLRSFLTIVGSRPDTEVTVFPTTQVKAGTGIEDVRNGLPITFTLQPYEVANLETPDVNAFGADFTGTQIIADGPVSVYTGSEASDAPAWPDLSERRCCADHLEEQLDPLRTAGRSYAFAHSPSRTAAVVAAGGGIQSVAEPEYVRFVAATNEPTVVRTTLPAPFDRLTLDRLGDHVDVESTTDFLADADFPVHAIQVMASQDAVNIPRELPGGDPSLLVVPPREQFRERYVFLTPDKYAFDFISIIAPRDATVVLDDAFVSDQQCEVRPTDGLSVEERGEDVVPELFTYTCQLSFAVVDPTTGDITEGVQNDGVHRVESDRAVGVIVFGFDRFVSYAYAAGTELQEIAAPL